MGEVVPLRHPDELDPASLICGCVEPTPGRYGGCGSCHRMTRQAHADVWRREAARLHDLIDGVVVELHELGVHEMADRLEREAAPF